MLEQQGTTEKVTKKMLALDRPASFEGNMFITQETASQNLDDIMEVAEGGSAVFVRAGVATGETTIATFMPESFSGRHKYVSMNT